MYNSPINNIIQYILHNFIHNVFDHLHPKLSYLLPTPTNALIVFKKSSLTLMAFTLSLSFYVYLSVCGLSHFLPYPYPPSLCPPHWLELITLSSCVVFWSSSPHLSPPHQGCSQSFARHRLKLIATYCYIPKYFCLLLPTFYKTLVLDVST